LGRSYLEESRTIGVEREVETPGEVGGTVKKKQKEANLDTGLERPSKGRILRDRW